MERFHSFQAIRFRKYLVLSTKANGIDPSAELVELAITDHDGHVLFNSLIKPEQALHSGALHRHRITNSMLDTAPSWPVVWPAVEAMIKDDICVMWHAEFHLRLMLQTMQRYQLEVPDRFGTEGFFCAMRDYHLWQGSDEYGAKQIFPLSHALEREKLMALQQPSALGDCMGIVSLTNHIERQQKIMMGLGV